MLVKSFVFRGPYHEWISSGLLCPFSAIVAAVYGDCLTRRINEKSALY